MRTYKWNEKGTFLGDNASVIPTLLNDVLGPRPAVLIGTKSVREVDNVAVFNTFQPLGARPPVFSLLIRPLDRQRDTYENMKTAKEWTVNFIRPEWYKQAHQTSDHIPEDHSEFEYVGLKPQRRDSIALPFVEEAPIQMHFEWLREIPIPENSTRLILGRMRALWLSEDLQLDAEISLEHYPVLSSWGLNHYVHGREVKSME